MCITRPQIDHNRVMTPTRRENQPTLSGERVSRDGDLFSRQLSHTLSQRAGCETTPCVYKQGAWTERDAAASLLRAAVCDATNVKSTAAERAALRTFGFPKQMYTKVLALIQIIGGALAFDLHMHIYSSLEKCNANISSAADRRDIYLYYKESSKSSLYAHELEIYIVSW